MPGLLPVLFLVFLFAIRFPILLLTVLLAVLLRTVVSAFPLHLARRWFGADLARSGEGALLVPVATGIGTRIPERRPENARESTMAAFRSTDQRRM